MTFSEKIKELRKGKGISQELASSDMGMAISSLRNYENGRLPDTEQLRKIQQYYDVPYEYLLNDECTTKNYGNINISKELGLSDKAIETLKYFKSYEEAMKEFSTNNKHTHISSNTIINEILSDKKFIETVTNYIVEEVINKDEIDNIKDYLNISDELYEYSRLNKIFEQILKVKEKLLKSN